MPIVTNCHLTLIKIFMVSYQKSGRFFGQITEGLEELGLKDIADTLDRGNVLSPAKPRARDEVLKDAIKKAEKFKAGMK